MNIAGGSNFGSGNRRATTATTPNGIFTASDSWVIPAGVFKIYVTGSGGGGSGGGGFGGSAAGGGGGGGSGLACYQKPIDVIPGDTVTITIGAQATGGTPGANGNNGNATILAFTSVAELRLNGGNYGAAGTATNGGAGGACGNFAVAGGGATTTGAANGSGLVSNANITQACLSACGGASGGGATGTNNGGIVNNGYAWGQGNGGTGASTQGGGGSGGFHLIFNTSTGVLATSGGAGNLGATGGNGVTLTPTLAAGYWGAGGGGGGAGTTTGGSGAPGNQGVAIITY